jgi:hypothetical protein
LTGGKPMSEFEEQTVLALKILFDKVGTLRHIYIRELLIMIQTRSPSDLIIEVFEKKFSKMYDEL